MIMNLDEYKKSFHYTKEQAFVFELFQKFFQEAYRKCEILCKENGITIDKLDTLYGEYRNITTFELANGWQLDYCISHSYIHYDKASFDSPIVFTFLVFPDGRRARDRIHSPNALFKLETEERLLGFPGWTFDICNTFINPRLFLMCKFNQNHLDVITSDTYLISNLEDSRAIQCTKSYDGRMIEGDSSEISLMNELIDSLSHMNIIKNLLYRYEDDSSKFGLDGVEIKLPLSSNNKCLFKKNKMDE